MSPEERRAWIHMFTVLLVAAGLRLAWQARGPQDASPGRERDTVAALDTIRALAEEAARRSRPLAQGERLDPNQVDEVELDRLPGIGPSTAAAIIAARQDRAFGVVDDLLRVRGIGQATLERLRPHLKVDGPSPRRTRTLGEPGDPRIDVNRADSADLLRLPGIGPALAARIVAERTRRGAFVTVADLSRVTGIGPATVARLSGHVRTR